MLAAVTVVLLVFLGLDCNGLNPQTKWWPTIRLSTNCESSYPQVIEVSGSTNFLSQGLIGWYCGDIFISNLKLQSMSNLKDFILGIDGRIVLLYHAYLYMCIYHLYVSRSFTSIGSSSNIFYRNACDHQIYAIVFSEYFYWSHCRKHWTIIIFPKHVIYQYEWYNPYLYDTRSM